ncbi:fatty acid hydroxylase superfamily-domain-containing protein [Limtongia smithiae]|uniref:fatty acid hydroxylase superfamily-domain-containing protein n=1 Tax=Limtongia smithiae TaxID=1125753 RepID=UPI0034CE25AD
MNTSYAGEFLAAPPPTVELRPREPLLSFMSDQSLSLMLPIAVYWVVSIIFHYIDDHDLLAKYRIHTPEEVKSRNKATVHEVIRDVIVQQIMQTIVGVFLTMFDPPDYVGMEGRDIWMLAHRFPAVPLPAIEFVYHYGFSFVKILGAFFVLDTWQYFLHRAMHSYKYLYKTFHSRHHRLYVPYAFGALYNHPFEGLLMDTIGAGLSFKLCGLTIRESLIFFAFSTVKTVDDHCGYSLPWDPLQIFFQNNAAYHDIHHQQFGIKTNFSQPFFIVWDKWLGTQYKGRYPKRGVPPVTPADETPEAATTPVEKTADAKKEE